ncbi:hypothetical protein GCM10011583_52610 [Streptomyces camponoticapitis]|uniref:Integral membrane protein n=1 Tax=Streptomyces camponoticapitis TaxID=1616125 RepID=A0ABQ2EJ90_9ACTN|nr:hypothetical protein [Streptomyces camponoticapitis]GGK14075.1 hypothetical protein GCM10011583_52610 [Streptomyces camponoticapitis]
MTTAPAADARPSISRAELRGRATGVGVMAFFGLGWTACGVTDMPVTAGRAVFALGVAVTITFAVLGSRMSRRAADAPTSGEPTADRKKKAGLRFALVVVAEWVAIFVIARVLVATDHAEAIPAFVAAVVGVHFFPLARLFGVRVYHLTGAAICAAALAAAVLAPLTSTPALWTALPGFGSAAALYATSVSLLRTPPHGMGRDGDQ